MKRVFFSLCISGYEEGVSANGFSISLLDMEEMEHSHLATHRAINESDGQPQYEPINGHYFMINLLGSNQQARPIVGKSLNGYYNYFLDNDSSRWATNALATILLSRCLSGIDYIINREQSI